MRTVLFLKPPGREQLSRYPGLQAIGVAGGTRALAADAMEAELRPAFEALRALQPRFVHYKVCSTFDSSPTVGSIGRAIDVGADVFAARWVPLLVGTPELGRYCVFGNLFARSSTGGEGQIYRLDRHPSMSRHPVTPAQESDLRVTLAAQTQKQIGVFDILKSSMALDQARMALDRVVASGAEIVLFDILESRQLPGLGALIDGVAEGGKPTFLVGSSGVEAALGAYWVETGSLHPVTRWPAPGRVGALLVVSGSCSPITAAQIDWAKGNGFSVIEIDPCAVDEAAVARKVVGELRAGRDTIVCTSREKVGIRVSASELGATFGRMALTAIDDAGLRRLVVAGGDTSSYAGRALGIEALEMIAPLVPGAPLCRVVASGKSSDGLEVVFKGGQVGGPGFFGVVADGRTRKGESTAL